MDKFKKLDQFIEQVLAERAYPIADFPAEFGDDNDKDKYNKNVDKIKQKIGSLATNAPDEKVVDKVIHKDRVVTGSEMLNAIFGLK